MNIINKLTIRHLKENKRRTLVTIIGVIISVAMITAVATLGVSFLDLMIRHTIAQDGEWHVQYKDVKSEQVEALRKDDATKKLILSRDRGYAVLPGSENESKPYLFIKEYNEAGFKQFPIKVTEGRFPNKENEVVISEHIAENAKVEYKIGDQLKLEIGNRMIEGTDEPLTQNDPLQIQDNMAEGLQKLSTKTFTVVGVIKRPDWEPLWAPGYTIISYLDQKSLASTETVNAVIVLNKVNSGLYDHAEKLSKELGIKKIDYHTDLLRYYGVTDMDNLRTTLYSLAGIIMLVVIIGSVALIYNAFAISVSERARHLGMLSSVGATKIQKRNSVFFEGAIIGAISIPIGIASGLGGIALTFWFINSFIEGALNVTERLKVVVTSETILIACTISIATIFISTYWPARRASRISAIDAIRQTQDVKLTGKAVKTSKLVRNLFGLEAEIGLKNLKRNKKRYVTTVFSLVISIVLFLTVSFFTENLKKSIELSQDGLNFDIQLMGDRNTGVEDLEPFTKLQYVTETTMIEQTFAFTGIDQDQIPVSLKKNVEQDKSILEDGKYPYNVVIYALDEESFKSYSKQVGVDVSKLRNTDMPSVIIIDKIKYKDYQLKKVIESKSIHTNLGAVIDLYSMNYETEEKTFMSKVEVAALTDQLPMGVQATGLGGIDIVLPRETLSQLIDEQAEKEVQTYLYMNSSAPLKTQDAIDKLKPTNIHVFNIHKNRQRDEQMILMMSVFTYGFITLISLISIANIFNTISTSISLRKREFAMLRSVGMTPKGFNKMINYESMFYGLQSLLFGLPISVIVMGLIYWSLSNTFDYGFALPWMSILFVVVAIFVIVSSAMLYSIAKIKKENIIDGLKQENI